MASSFLWLIQVKVLVLVITHGGPSPSRLELDSTVKFLSTYLKAPFKKNYMFK